MKTPKRKQRDSAPAPAAVAVEAPAEMPAEPPVDAPVAAQFAEAGPADLTRGFGLTLASHCTVKDAAALKDSLYRLAESGQPVSIDIGSVERVDTATMQLLCAFVRDCTARAGQVIWSGDSQVLRDAARLLGVSELLALPQTASETSTLGVAA